MFFVGVGTFEEMLSSESVSVHVDLRGLYKGCLWCITTVFAIGACTVDCKTVELVGGH